MSPVFQSRGEPAAGSGPSQLGTFIGVYTPTILTILGVIMYLRFGWVLGQVGLSKTLLIVLIANVITLITSLSLSAVATNTRVGVGGAYFIISRSLGIEIGGAIGLPLFLSQIFSVTLYAFGLAESLRIIWPDVPVSLMAFIIILAVGALALRGAGSALRLQVPILLLIVCSLIALAAGSLSPGEVTLVSPESVPLESFWVVFAVFFPAVTGIMAGLGLSGDLSDPRQSIPRGTLLAVATGLLVYLLIPCLLAVGASREALLADPLIWTKISWLGPWLILPGLWGAIFSSAVGSMLGAPRTLQALAVDRLAPRLFTRKSEKGEPVVGLFVSLGIALVAVFLGDLNTVATVVTMFFLTVYGTTNLVAAFESLSGNPSWRPRINVPWWVSLLGAAGCFGAMLLISPVASVLAVSIEFGLWVFLKRRWRRNSPGNVWRDIYVALIRWALIRLGRQNVSARNWRPHLLVFVGDVERRLDLARFGSWLSENRGVVTVCELQEGALLDMKVDPEARQREINQVLSRAGITAFGEMNVVQNVEKGIVAVAQASGLASLESNTILLGWPDRRERLITFLKVIRSMHRLNKSLLIGHIKDPEPLREGQKRSIHIWWGGLQRNGDLMLLLAYLLTRNPEWRQTEIRVLSIASNKHMQRQTVKFLEALIPEIRIEAEISVMVKPEDRSVKEMIHQASGAADLVMLGLAVPDVEKEADYADRLTDLVEGLSSWLLVSNGSLFVGDLVTPEAIEEEPEEAEEEGSDPSEGPEESAES